MNSTVGRLAGKATSASPNRWSSKVGKGENRIRAARREGGGGGERVRRLRSQHEEEVEAKEIELR